MTVIVVSNGLIGASLGMVIFTSAIRSIPIQLFTQPALTVPEALL